MNELRLMREDLGIPVASELDPAGSGVIGRDFSDITTTLGDLRAKQISLNPRFAGLLVTWLKQAGVCRGDSVAVSLTGSFPALNLATLCACDELGLRACIISSVGASSYGANIYGFTWLDMESRLVQKGLVHSSTSYASLGGIIDEGGGLDGTGIAEGEAAIARHGAVYLREGSSREVVRDIEQRMHIYIGGNTPTAFINVGGNVTSLGWVSESSRLGSGLLRSVPACSSVQRGIIFRMFESGIPVIHLLHIERIAAENHLAVEDSGAASSVWNADGPEGNFIANYTHFLSLMLLLILWLAIGAGAMRYEGYALKNMRRGVC